jgi:HSP20 family protein
VSPTSPTGAIVETLRKRWEEEAVAVTTPARREPARLGDLFDWLEDEVLPMPLFRSFAGRNLIRVEDYTDEGQYVLRAELPGIDPDKDVDIAVADGVLTVRAERREAKSGVHRSEFRYGAFRRSVSLPAGADESDVTARYTNGVLEIRIGVKEGRSEPKRIPITRG